MVNVNFTKRDAVWAALLIVFIGIGVGYALNSGDYNLMGHTADEIEGVCLSDGTNCPSLGGVEYYESGELDISYNTNIGGAHGLTNVFGAQIWLKAVVAERGYSVGEEVLYASGGNFANTQGGNSYRGANLRVSGNDIWVRIPASGINVVESPDGSNDVALNPSRWKIIIRAWGTN